MQVISVVNMKGGVGKTTLALNLADCLARSHQKRVAVLDVDPQFNATQCLISGEDYVALLRRRGDTILNVFDGERNIQAGVVDGAVAIEPKELSEIKLIKRKSVWLLPGNIDLYRLEMVAGEGREFLLKRFLEQNSESELANFDYIIIDTPPTPSIWMTSALIASNYYIIPVRPDPLSVIGIDLLRAIIDRRRKTYGLEIENLGVVFTMVERPDSVIYGRSRDSLAGNAFWRGKIFSQYIPKRVELARDQLSQPFMLDTEDYDLRNNLRALVQEILEKVDES